MKCYDCSTQSSPAQSSQKDAIGICNHCSVGLCAEHGALLSDPILVNVPVNRTVALAKQARELLCHVCLDALRQRDVREDAPAESLSQ